MIFKHFTRPEMVDPKATMDYFPRRIWAEGELLPEYRTHISKWIRAGVPYEHMIFVPKPPYQREAREYMLVLLEGGLLFLEKGADGRVTPWKIGCEAICGLCMSEELLLGGLDIYWKDGGRLRRSTLSYNRARKDLFYPAVNRLLGQPDDFDCHLASVRQPISDRLKSEQSSLYNYSEEAFRLGTVISGYDWWNTRPDASGFRKKKVRGQYASLFCRLQGGQCVIHIRDYRIEIWYLPASKGGARVVEEERKKRLEICLYDGKDEIVVETIKISPEK